MNDKTKDGLKLGGMISLLVGVISLIVVIPTIARIMKSPPIAEYHVKFSTNVAISEYSSGDIFNIVYVTIDDIDNYILQINYKLKAEYDTNYYTLKSTIKPTAFGLVTPELNVQSTLYTNFDLGFGLYDFSSYTTITEGQILTPVFTAF